MNQSHSVISIDSINELASQLKAYRGSGREGVIFDARDAGNFAGYRWDSTVEMLIKADPTGLSIGLLLYEMIEATIRGSKVDLKRVLLDDGFIQELQQILTIKRCLLEKIEAPMTALMDRINAALSATAEGLGQASTRELAVCLRDAIYSIEQGLTLRWLVCDEVVMPAYTPVCNTILQFKDIAEFSDALRNTLPWGGHLARIGKDKTAVGIKQPGRIGFLSSMSLNVHGGGMYENRASGHHMAEKLDLDTAVERYPDWLNATRSRATSGGHFVATEADAQRDANNPHPLDHLAKLPRDVLVWFAMLVEIASQRMAKAVPAEVELSENVARALPTAEADIHQNLPMLIQPNWIASELTIEQGLADLRFTPWELTYFAPALAQISLKSVLPFGSEMMSLNVDTGLLSKSDEDAIGSFNINEFRRRNVRIIPVSPDWVGTREEADKARKSVFLMNLGLYLLTWGNLHFNQEWEDFKGWFKEKLVTNFECAMNSSCVKLEGPNFQTYKSVHLYSQSAKHKTYNPRCYLNSKSLVTHVAHFNPQSGADVIEMFGLKGEHELPEFLRGWTRNLGWTTQNAFGSRSAPIETNLRWDFCHDREQIITACVNLNLKNLPDSLQNRFSVPLTTA